MKLWEAVKAMQEGKKVRCVGWKEGCYIYIDYRGCVNNADGEYFPEIATWFGKSYWEIYFEPRECRPLPAEWISVKERLPQHGVWVLFIYNTEKLEMGVYMKDAGFCDPDMGYRSFSKVTYWRPLPPLPEEYD